MVIEKVESKLHKEGYGNLMLQSDGSEGQIIFLGEDLTSVDHTQVVIKANIDGRIKSIKEKDNSPFIN